METSTTKAEIAGQVKNAFSFIQKLYNESSYLIKEIEGQLSINELSLQLLRPSGYSISARSSTGLEPNNVNMWLLRRFAVAFVEQSKVQILRGQTQTAIDATLKVLYFRIILDDKNQTEPMLNYGVFYNVKILKKVTWISKFESLMAHFEYNDNKVFAKPTEIEYEDAYVKLKGLFKKVKLLEINSSEELMKKVIEPSLELYQKVK